MTDANRTNWLRRRQKGLGGTDMASIAGVGFQSALEVYEEKIAPEPIDRAPSVLMKMGLATEEINAALFAEKAGARLDSPGLVCARQREWAFSTLDYVVNVMTPEENFRASFGEPVDTKYVGPFFGDRWGDEFTDEAPEGYIVQSIWQQFCISDGAEMPVRRGHLSALSGSGDHRIFTIPFDARLAAMLVDLGAAFWWFVQNRESPTNWSHPLQADIANRLAELRPDLAVDLGEESLNDVREYQLLKEREKEAKAEADAVKLRLIGALGGAGEGRLPDGQRITQKIVNRKAYAVEATSYVDFRISKPKKAKV